jgi:hypothetical protein
MVRFSTRGEELNMSKFLFFVVTATALFGSPAFTQVIVEPPVGSSDTRTNMPKSTETVPDRVRTYDPEVTGGIKVRSDLADKPENPAPRPLPR